MSSENASDPFPVLEKPWKKLLKSLFRVLLATYIILCLLLLFFQNTFIFFPGKAPTRTPESAGLIFQNLYLPSSNNNKINAWYVPATQARGTVVFCHGNAGNMAHRISTLTTWHELGYNIIAFDYQGFGASQGSPSEENCYADVRAVYQWLRDNDKLQGRIIIHGRSLGGGVATLLASEIDYSGLILESTFTSIGDMASTVFPFLPTSILCLTDFNNLERVKKLDRKSVV